MGKLLDNLQKQLESPDHRKDAEDCIEIYNWLSSTDPKGSVWSSRWTHLVDTRFKGLPSDERTYKPNVTGYALLKSIEYDKKTSIFTEGLDQLIEDYQRRLKTIKDVKKPDLIADTRLRTKVSCYRTIITELERVKASFL